MHAQYKIIKKIESYKVLWSITFLYSIRIKKVSVIQLRRLDNKFFTVGARPQVVS